jgi:Tol biopolymer transport system component
MSVLALLLACGAAAAPPSPEAELFGDGIVSTADFETHPSFTPDGRTLYFVKSTPQFSDWKIYQSERTETGWSAPKMAPFSGTYRDADPYVTADGKRLYFISDRPVDGKPKEDMDIWVMERTAEGAWGPPRNLGAPVNSPGSEWLPRPAANGTLYFGSDRPGGHGKTDLYRSKLVNGTYAEPENLGPAINSGADEYEPCIAPDESFLVFMAAGRPDDTGGGDLYISYSKDGAWTAPRNLGPTFNRRGLDIAPYLSLDGKWLYFASGRKAGGRNGLGDIYRVPVETLH